MILVGIDGASWGILAPLVMQGRLPCLQRLMSKSVVGVMKSTVPPESPPAWTSIFTGVNPGKHGIVDFVLREKGSFVACRSRYRMVRTIWSILSDANKKCVIVNDPVTYPPEEINGTMTTGLLTPPGSNDWVYPKQLRKEVNIVARGYLPDVPSDFSSLIATDRRGACSMIHEMAHKTFRVSKYLAGKMDWELMATIFTSTDRLQHFWWKDYSEIERHYEMLDAMLGEYARISQESGAELFLVSDHGFAGSNKLFPLDKWLEHEGLAVYHETFLSKSLHGIGLTRERMSPTNEKPQSWLDRRTIFETLPASIQDALRKRAPQSRRTLDSSKSTAYTREGSHGIYLTNKSDMQKVSQKLIEVRDEAGQAVFENIIDMEQELKGPYSYRAPDIYGQPAMGYDLAVGKQDVEHRRSGVHRPDGIFLHYTQGSPAIHVRENVTVRPWDIAAIILEALDVEIPSYFDGRPEPST